MTSRGFFPPQLFCDSVIIIGLRQSRIFARMFFTFLVEGCKGVKHLIEVHLELLKNCIAPVAHSRPYSNCCSLTSFDIQCCIRQMLLGSAVVIRLVAASR